MSTNEGDGAAMKAKLRAYVVAIAAFANAMIPSSSRASAITVETSNFISSPTYFNDFEDIGSSPNTSVVPGPYKNFSFYPINTLYSQGGITVQEVSTNNGDGYGRVPVWNTESYGMSGNYDWAPQDQGGYTDVTLSSGANFQSLQFLANGILSSPAFLEYALLENGEVVATGSVLDDGYCCGVSAYLGFSGGGFNEVELQEQLGLSPMTFDPNAANALVIDNVAAVALSEPPALPLFVTGLCGLGLLGWRRRRKAEGNAI